MIEVLQTHQGLSFSIDRNLSSIPSRQNLLETLAKLGHIQIEDLICMTREGEQLTDEVFDQLQENDERGISSSRTPNGPPVALFIFDRQYLYADLDMLAQELEEEPTMEAIIEEAEYINPPTPRGLASLLHWCSATLEHMTLHTDRSEQYLAQLRIIDEGTKVALKNLISHSSSVKIGCQDIQTSAGDELAKMERLLKGHAVDLKILSLVPINNKLLPDSKGRSKERSLSDYVSPTKMGAVYEACSNVHAELQAALSTLRSNGVQLTEDTDGLRQEVQSTSVEPSNETLQESIQALSRARELSTFLQDNCAPDQHGWPAAQRLSEDVDTLRAVEEAAGELVLLDEVCRESLRRLCADKNDMTARSLHLLSDISSLQSEYADLGIELAQFDAEIKSNRTDGFRHLLRLKNMLWAYGMTMIEIFRRQGFEHHFLVRSQALAELMANFSESERQRRLDFRSNVVGALPWEIKGMEESTPSLDISTGPTISRDESVKLQKEDIDRLFEMLDAIAQQIDTPEGSEAIGDITTALRQSLRRIEEVEAEFLQLVQQTLLESEDGSEGEDGEVRKSHRGKKEHEQALQQVKIEHGERIRSMSQAHDQELVSLQAELSKMRADLRHTETLLEREQGQNQQLRSAADSSRVEADEERRRATQLSGEAERAREENERLKRSLREWESRAGEGTEKIDELVAHLRDVQLELEEVKAAHDDASKRVEALLSKGTSFEGELQVAQERIDELTRTLSEVRSEAREARDALSEAEQARDKAMRTHRAEADSDRAILEENLRTKSGEVEDAQSTIHRLEADIAEHVLNVKNLQSQLIAADDAHSELVRQLEQTKEAAMDAEMSKRQSDRHLQATMEKSRALVSRTILLSDVLRRLPSLAGQTTKSGNKLVSETRDKLDESAEKERQRSFDAFKHAGDAASVETILEVLAWLTKAPVEDAAIEKLELLTTLCKKWMKAYKHTNEKGQKQQLLLREKITFRNFNVGDLALFLPTRGNAVAGQQDNSTQNGGQTQAINFAKPWAAFNINFPHYFLNFDGKPENEQLRDNLRQKEWIVARIVKIESKVASSRSTDGNPFNLAEGVRFFLLDVENWNLANSVQSPPNARRKSASTAVGIGAVSKEDAAPPPLRRWESTPDTAVGSVPVPTMTDKAEPEVTAGDEAQSSSDEKKASTPLTNASNGSPPVAEEVASSRPEQTAVPAPKPSGLSLALRQPLNNLPSRGGGQLPSASLTATSPERNTFVNNDLSTRWGTSAGSRTGQTPSSSIASDRYVSRLANSSTPAFGRARRFARPSGGAAGNGEEGQGASIRSSASSPSQTIGDRKSIIGVMLQHDGVSRLRTEDAVQTPNPFSSSPAPGAADGIAAMEKAMSAKEAESGKGKGRETATETNGEVYRPQSRTSQTSSRRTPLSINSRSAAILSPRIRAPDQAKATMEIAQGLNSFGHVAYTSEGSQSGVAASPQTAAAGGTSSLGSQPSASGFSLRSSLSAGSGLSVGQQASQTAQRRTSSTSQPSDKRLASPSPRRTSFFGSSWTLGRKSGTQASSSVLLEDNDGDLSATIVDARQSLRRLKSSKR